MTDRINAIVVGATGYVGGELLRLIAGHPTLALHAAVSTSRDGMAIRDLYPALTSHFPRHAFVTPDDAFAGLGSGDPVALFSAAPHGSSARLVASLLDEAAARSIPVHVVDCSADFRYTHAADFERVYGEAHGAPELLADFTCALPEHLAKTNARHIGHPGCFATAVLLAAVPLAAAGLIDARAYVTGVTGSTGSGRSPSAGTHHPERHGNLYAYKPLAHRHVPEIEQLITAATGAAIDVSFVPHSGPFARGIHVTLQAPLAKDIEAGSAIESVRAYYAKSPFVDVLPVAPKLKDVVVSNRCHLGVVNDRSTVCVMAAIDNLVKGAAGGAVQWMNRLWGLPEYAGLDAPAPAWT